MKYTERRDFIYDPEVFKRKDVEIAAAIHAEYIKRHAPVPNVTIFEVSRASNEYDALWHMPKSSRTQFSRQLQIPSIMKWVKPSWPAGRLNQVEQQVTVWFANLHLKEFDYYPSRGDLIYWNGYRLGVTSVDIPPESFWHQTNVWLGLTCLCAVVPDGDSKPTVNPAVAAPAEISPSAQVSTFKTPTILPES